MAGFTLNNVTISGNLTRDPELKTFGSGAALCEISVAVNERVKNGEEWEDRASFFDVKIWKGTGEWVAKNLSKGDGIAITGRLNQERWQNQQGENRSKVVIVADGIMPRGGSGGGGGNGGGQSRESAPAADFETPPVAPAPSGPPQPDDIPFMHEEFTSFEDRRSHASRW